MLNWLGKHKFQAHLIAFLLMVVASIGMLMLIGGNKPVLNWLMIIIFVAANILAIFIK